MYFLFILQSNLSLPSGTDTSYIMVTTGSSILVFQHDWWWFFLSFNLTIARSPISVRALHAHISCAGTCLLVTRLSACSVIKSQKNVLLCSLFMCIDRIHCEKWMLKISASNTWKITTKKICAGKHYGTLYDIIQCLMQTWMDIHSS